MSFSWDLAADLRQMWSLPFMVNAFRAGAVVAVVAGIVGWFVVLRRQTFAAHTLAMVGFPGAAAATLAGIGVGYGSFSVCIVAALLVGARVGRREQPAMVGTVQAFSLACGLLFMSWYGGFLNGTSVLMFGTFLGITSGQVTVLTIVALTGIAVLALLGRPLLFVSVDRSVARAHGVPTRAIDIAFMVLLGATAAAVSQITGALLVFSLLVLPPATAFLVSTRPLVSLALSVGFGLATVWCALFIGYYSPYPIGFWLTSIGFGGYVVARLVT